jgi:hypothetical protein
MPLALWISTWIMNLMTLAKIIKMQNSANIKFEAAKSIANLLVEASKAAGLRGDEARDFEAEILELINEED